MTRPTIKQLLKIRDALLREDVAEAYRLLYELADPEGKKPWEEWERIVEHQIEVVR